MKSNIREIDKFKKNKSYSKGFFGFLTFFLVAFFFIQYYSKNNHQTENIEQQVSVEDGIRFYNQGNYQQALEICRPAATQGYARTQYYLGKMYHNGRGLPVNERQAAQWYRKASEQGNADAQYYLGFMYHYGEGVQKDDQQAIKWYLNPAI